MSKESMYVVWNQQGRSPMVVHPTLEEARAEARRLACSNRGAQFFVLRAVESVKYREDPYECKVYCKS